MNRFQEMIASIYNDHVYIQTHNFPDPDAIASAFGLSELLRRHGISSSICYKGKIERYSTNGFVQRLGIELTDLNTIDMNPEDEVILVDSQKGNSNIVDAPGNEIICIDHHPSFDDVNVVNYRFSDIRPDVGSCSSIIAQYYRDSGEKIDKRVATALFMGIKSDTMGLSRGVSQVDVDMCQWLFGESDLSIIQSLEHCSLKFDDLKAYANAINSIQVFDNVSFANTGYDCPEALIATISDFMLDIIEVDFSVVYSVKDEGIRLSVRSMGVMDAGRITNLALRGIGSGGGHASMAGGFVPFWEKSDNINTGSVIGMLKERFLSVINAFDNTKIKNEEN